MNGENSTSTPSTPAPASKPKPRSRPKRKAARAKTRHAKRSAKAVKKATKRRAIGGFKLGAAVSTDKVKFYKPKGHGTIYQPILDKIAKLKAGKTQLIDVTQGTTAAQLQNRLNSALRRAKIEAPKGCHFEKRTTDDRKQIGIACVKDAVRSRK